MKPLRLYALLVACGLAGACVLACSSADDGGADDQDVVKGRRNRSGDDDDSSPTTSSDEKRRPTDPTPVPETDAGADGATGSLACEPVPSCANMTSLPAITGDGNGTTTSANGVGSKWFSIQVTEKSNASEPLGITATLDTKAGSQLDLYLYDLNCTTLLHSSTGEAARKVVWLDWQDLPLVDNSRTLVLEVRQTGGACDADHGWDLFVAGGSGL